VTVRTSSPDIAPVADPLNETADMILWNKASCRRCARTLIEREKGASYFRVDGFLRQQS
jgi:hypothetical protein